MLKSIFITKICESLFVNSLEITGGPTINPITSIEPAASKEVTAVTDT